MITDILSFNGFIKGVSYKAHLTEPLKVYDIDTFDINESKPYGIIKTINAEIGYSKWVSPKRTRTYPFERIYNTYNLSKSLTVIPVIKDEGKDGDMDKIQFSTVSWMNLLNIYIVIAYYEKAEKNFSPAQQNRQKLTHQRMNNLLARQQIEKILHYKQSALHWNKNLFEEHFAEIFKKAMKSYEMISQETGVEIHDQTCLYTYLEKVTEDFEQFKNISLKSSESASKREIQTIHKAEYLNHGTKAKFVIENYLGGIYYLTADEIVVEEGVYVIQESKNTTTGFLPSLSDIRDGLFKLILYSNLSTLEIQGKSVPFITRLKLTGLSVESILKLPCSDEIFECFLQQNSHRINKRHKEILIKLKQEASNNKITIEVSRNR